MNVQPDGHRVRLDWAVEPARSCRHGRASAPDTERADSEAVPRGLLGFGVESWVD